MDLVTRTTAGYSPHLTSLRYVTSLRHVMSLRYTAKLSNHLEDLHYNKISYGFLKGYRSLAFDQKPDTQGVFPRPIGESHLRAAAVKAIIYQEKLRPLIKGLNIRGHWCRMIE